MDYEALQTRVKAKINRLDSAGISLVPDWINEARRQIADGSLPVDGLGYYRFSWLYTDYDKTLTSGTNLYDWESDCLDELDLFYKSSNKPINKVDSPAHMDALFYRGSDYDATGPPTDYCIKGTQFQIYPTPDSAYVITERYNAYPVDLVADDDEKDIDTRQTGLVLSASCLLAALYLHDQELIELYMHETETRYWNAVTRDNRAKLVNRPKRMKTFRDFSISQWRAMRGN